MPTLMVYLPGLPPVSHLVKDETTTIGRMKGNTIVIEDVSISLMHAKITRKNGEFYLKDLNSTNGTNINGQPVSEARLKDTDRVRFAEVSAQFLAEPVVEANPAVAAPQVTSAPPIPAAIIPAPLPAMSESAKAPAFSARPAVIASASAPAIAAPVVSGSRKTDFPRSNRSKITSWVSAGAGALAALGVISVLGWRFFHLDEAKANAGSELRATKKTQISSSAPSQVAERQLESTAPANNPAAQPPLTTDPLELAILLKSKDPVQRRAVARALHSIGPEASHAAAGLRQALKDPDEEVRMWSALALVNSQQYDKAAVPILIHALQNENSVLRQVACLSLGLVPYEDPERDLVVPALAETAGKDVDEEVRKAARSALNIIAPDLYGKAQSTTDRP
jgi:hypothetical protein